jgi:protein gp37
VGITTGISWTDATWNPWMGCVEVSPGCENCYAKRDAHRFGGNFHEVRKSKTMFNAPVEWMRSKKLKYGSTIFTCSISDFFIEKADPWRPDAWNIMKNTPYIYLVLTKREKNILDRLPEDWNTGYPNVYLGVTAENNKYAERFNSLEYIPCEKKFISYEPALGPIDVRDFCLYNRVDWIIGGGESDTSKARPMNVHDMSVVQQTCQVYHVPFFFKQVGGTKRINGVWGGDMLVGKQYKEVPEISDRTREFLEGFE